MSYHRANGNGTIPVGITMDGRKVRVSLPSLLLDAMDARAARCGETRSAYVRRLIEDDLHKSGVEQGA